MHIQKLTETELGSFYSGNEISSNDSSCFRSRISKFNISLICDLGNKIKLNKVLS